MMKLANTASLLLRLTLFSHAVQADQTRVSVCVEALEQLETLKMVAPVYKLTGGQERKYLADADRPAEVARLKTIADGSCSAKPKTRQREESEAEQLHLVRSPGCIEDRERLSIMEKKASRTPEDDLVRTRKRVAIEMPDSPSIYVGSVPASDFLPGFAALNPMPLLSPAIGPRVWIGHAANVSSHYDTVDNLACVAAGTRRFTLFAPQSIDKLYVGPIDNTMAGQPVSLAASSPPDKDRFPLFEEIKGQSLVAELAAGDALYLPKLWWHKVESTAPFNVLVNYWWDAFRTGPDAPHTSMLLAMITIADRPAAERQAWKAFFDHYVFRTHGHPLAHLPPEQHGILGSLKENYGKIRARVMHLLRGA
jgi:Cupin-like domain